MSEQHDTMKLQLAMAFGQGSGMMLADEDALNKLLSQENELISKARENWPASRWPFLELVRLLGHASATRAAMGGSAVIRWDDVAKALPGVMAQCPCIDRRAWQDKYTGGR